MTGEPIDSLLTAREVGALLAVPSSWVYAESRAGRLPTIPVGRYRRYRLSAVEAWIAEVEQQPLPERRDGDMDAPTHTQDNRGPLMTAQEVGAMLGVPASWVYEQSRHGRIPTVPCGRYRRYRRAAIEAWIAKSEIDPA
jgi:excisionase family DNA binding protein